MAAIGIAGLRKTYPGSNLWAVDGIDLDIRDGEVMALVGPSGCGKTTTLQLLAGFLTPDAGTIAVGGKVVSSARATVPPEKRRMSLIFQSYAVWPHKTVFENVAYGLHVLRCGRSEIEDRVKGVLGSVHLTELAQRYPGELSGGQQQRVALARAIVVEPETLLLDEPLSNLDANLREEMRFEIRRLHDATGITMVYVTHDRSEAMVTSDRIAIMQAGRVAQVGAPGDVYLRPATSFIANFMGLTNTLDGTLIEPGTISWSGLRLRALDDSGARSGEAVTLCVRPHELRFVESDGAPAGYCGNGHNRLAGRIVRQTYLGDARDYLIDLGSAQVRVSTHPSANMAPGSAVVLDVPIDGCRIVPHT